MSLNEGYVYSSAVTGFEKSTILPFCHPRDTLEWLQ